ncbi:MAG: hypothetical protein OEZ39_02025 [Gammaproteobacteria bacterium]|nr:hypothetical protein [Gammaproteobacteria bacterium]MDH5650632.1 hypothetical protein [Gammaproteobacteria bacterium]
MKINSLHNIRTALLLISLSFISSCGNGDTPINTPPVNPGTPAVWQLPAGHFIPAKMPMHLVYPRPDIETGLHARHKFAHPNMRYEIPIGVQGGAWPFHYELLQGPAGASIGEVYGSANYGTISWQAPSSGTYTFKVRVTDQEQNTVIAQWEVAVDAGKFLFIQDGYSGTKIGTIDQPLEDIADWYKADRTDTTYHNRIVVFRGGNYTLSGDPGNNGNIRLDTATKTASLIGWPGETAVINCSTAKILTDDTRMHDLFVADLRWENGRQDVANAHFFWAIGDVTRATWWRNHFHNLGPGTAGTDNTLPVFVSSTGVLKQNILYKENNHTQINNYDYNGGYFEAYVSEHVLIEQNTASNSAVAYGFFAKGTRAYVSIRANTAVENVRGTQVSVGNGSEAGDLTHDHEICWNNIRAPQDNVLMMSSSTFYAGQTYNNHIYRNTIVGDTAWVRFAGAENYQVDGNVVITTDMNSQLSRWNTDIMDSDHIANLTGDGSEAFVDVTGKLQGDYRTQYLGTHGHEVVY